MLKVIEGENPDPFSESFFNLAWASTIETRTSIGIYDPFGNLYGFDLITSSPSTSMGYLISGFCLTKCINTGSTPPNGPGIWLFSGVPTTDTVHGWSFYLNTGVPSSYFIAGLSYSPPTVSIGTSSPSSPGDIVYQLINFTQSITNTLSSPVDVYTIMLVGAVYGSLALSPVYMPVTFYVFSPPIVFSPGVTMTVSVTLSFPIGIAITPVPESSVFVL